MEKGLISIVVPTKDEERRLKLLFPSLIRQTYKNFEVIINDDDRTSDGTFDVVRRYEKKLRIKYIKRNKSMAQGRVMGAKEARGEFLLHLDADMTLTSGVLSACVEKMKDGFDACVIPEISVGRGYWAKVKAFEKSLYVGDEMMASARFVKTSVYNSVGGHNVRMVLSEDKDLHLRIKKEGFKLVHIKEPIYHHEGKLSLCKDLKKKYYYGRTAHIFIRDHPGHSIKQANVILRPAYLRNWKKMIASPRLSVSMILMKTLETVAATLGMLSSRVPVLILDPQKK